MRTLLLFVIGWCVACRSDPLLDLVGRADVNASSWPTEPIAALIERNPWAMVIGADLPLLEVYADGTVLRANPESTPDRAFLASQLTAAEMQAFQTFLDTSSSFWGLEDFYNLSPDITDQPTTEVVLAKDGRQKRVAVYGYSLGTVESPAYTQLPKNSSPDKLPPVFDRLAKTLASIKPSNSISWQPRFVEVMIWPYEHSPEEPMPWPSEWPAPGTADVIPRGTSFSIILPGTELENVRMFVGRRGEKQAVLFDGKKWSIAYRLVMPGGDVERRINAARAAHGV